MYKLKVISKTLIFLSAFIFLFSACSSLPKTYLEQQQLTADDRLVFNQKVYDYAWVKVNNKYFDPDFNGKDWVALGNKYSDEAVSATNTDQLYEVINKLLAELEVSHLNASRTVRKDMTSKSKKKGLIGIIPGFLEDTIYVSAVFPNSPAAKAGVQKGWLMVGRNGIKYKKGDKDAFNSIVGETVTYDFLDRFDHLHSLKMIPVKEKKLELIEACLLDNGILYLRLDRFENRSIELLRDRLKEYSKVKGLVLDLRTNPGGGLIHAQLAVGHFFPEAVEMGTFVTRKGKEKAKKSIDFFSLNFDKPMVIMISSRSGSGAELFSHILQFHQRATVIGQKTAGAMLGARKYKLPDSGEMVIPVLNYIGLNGKRLEGVGVVPDKEVPLATLDEIRACKDKDLEVALEMIHK